MEITVSEASKRWGITRQTIYKKIRQGKLSQLQNKKIDVAEMVRVFGEPNVNKVKQDTVTIDNRLQSEQEASLQERIRTLEDNLRKAQEHERIAQAREQWLQKQVDKLTDTVKLLEFKKTEKDEKKGLWGRLFG